MKFFNSILISYYRIPYLNHPCDVPNIAEPFHLLSHLYSKLHNLSPKNAYPSNVSLSEDTPSAKHVNSCPSIVLLYHLYLFLVDTLYAYVHDLCLQHLSKSLHLHYYKLELIYLGNDFELHHPIPYTCIWYTKLYEHLNDLLCGSQSYFPFTKSRKIFRNYKSCTKSA